jgi:hypothetical protein
VEQTAAAYRARPRRRWNVYCLAFRSSRRTLVFFVSIFSQSASVERADATNEVDDRELVEGGFIN